MGTEAAIRSGRPEAVASCMERPVQAYRCVVPFDRSAGQPPHLTVSSHRRVGRGRRESLLASLLLIQKLVWTHRWIHRDERARR
jgi:hypothetical protein